MGTLELLIVFAALMAVIALVGISIDWVGRPLKNRRFIPRIYRYDDEVPDDLPAGPVAVPSGPVGAPMVAGPMMAPPGVPIAGPPPQMPVAPPAPAPLAAGTPTAVSTGGAGQRAAAFSGWIPSGNGNGSTEGASGRPRGIAQTVPDHGAAAWNPGMPLDTRVGDAKPTAAVKAERFWRTLASQTSGDSHFDEANLARMHEGRAPTRRNPRSGDIEAMELLGLRAASHRSDITMSWPGDVIDPWGTA